MCQLSVALRKQLTTEICCLKIFVDHGCNDIFDFRIGTKILILFWKHAEIFSEKSAQLEISVKIVVIALFNFSDAHSKNYASGGILT